ncbi:hypothetical protein CLV90_1553 [Maribacter spongiicola]|uniref:Uncharacterized protein n=1 Tax=Maribacter spongiicola TaxID=1206753 RepID=A0A4R7K840_9FLAO|nr:hypothetical protein CLV90_1553 [Maribacter spongiicola]
MASIFKFGVYYGGIYIKEVLKYAQIVTLSVFGRLFSNSSSINFNHASVQTGAKNKKS